MSIDTNDNTQAKTGIYSRRRFKDRFGEAGNVFFTLFGAVAVVGVLGAGIMSTLRGPLSTMVEVNRREQAQAELRVAASLILTASDDESCEGVGNGDGYTEGPAPAGSGPTGGGVLPSVGAPQNDPWGNAYGYCAWNHGPGSVAADTAACGTVLGGTTTTNQIAIAVISSGPDGVFQTDCVADGAAADDYIAPDGGAADDIVVTMTYDQAITGSGGLWNPVGTDTAQISRDLDVTGGASFTDVLDLSGPSAQLRLGASSLVIPDEGTIGNGQCIPANEGIVRRNSATDEIEVCDGSNFVSSAGLWTTGTGDDIYYNTTGTPQVGIGTTTPDDTLDVVGTTDLSGTLDVGGNTTLSQTLTVTGISNLNNDVVITGSTTNASADALTVRDSSSSVIFTVQNDGMVGINDAAPSQELDVEGDIMASESFMMDGVRVLYNAGGTTTGTILLGQDAGSTGTPITGNNNTVLGAATATTLTTGTDNILIGQGIDTPAATTSNYLNIGNAVQADLSSGNVGVGFAAGTDVTTFNDALEVSGNIDGTGTLNITGTSSFGNNVTMTGDTNDGSTDVLTIEDSDNNTVFTIDSNGRVDAGDYFFGGGNDLTPNSTCPSGSFNRWTGTDWACDTDGVGGGGGDGVGSDGFTDLADTPANYTGAGGQVVTVNSGATGLEFTDIASIVPPNDRIEDTGDGNTYIDTDTDDADSNNTIEFHTAGAHRVNISSLGVLQVGGLGSGANGQLRIGNTNNVNPFTIVDFPTETLLGPGNTKRFVIRSGDGTEALEMPNNNGNINILNQLGVGVSAPDASALTEMVSTTQGFLTPRMTIAQRDLIGTPATGLLVFTTDAGTNGIFQFYDGSGWIDVGGGGASTGIWQPDDGGEDFIEYDDTLGGVRIGAVTGQPAPLIDWTIDAANSIVFTSGKVGATEYCDENGNNCVLAGNLGSSDRIEDTGDQNTFIDVDTDDADGNDSIVFNTAGSERMQIDNAGNIGVGIAPTSTSRMRLSGSTNVLELTGTVSAGSDIYMNANGVVSAEQSIYFNIDSDNDATDRSFIFSKDASTSAGSVLMALNESGSLSVGSLSASDGSGSGGQALLLDVEGALGATHYCDENGLNCVLASALGGGAGVTAINDLTDAATTTNNIFLGNDGGFFGANDIENTAIGTDAMDSLNNSTAIANTAVGYNALTNLTSGDDNTAVGKSALQSVTTGARNTAVGRWSAQATNGDRNVVMGLSAMYTTSGTAANRNVAIGDYAMFDLGGNDNVFIGEQAGSGSAAANVNQNTVVGSDAGLNLTTGGDNNVLIGHQAGDNLTTGQYNIIIGSGVDAPNAASDDRLIIGNLIYGHLEDNEVFLDAPATAPPDADLLNSQITFWLDDGGDQIELKARDASGDIITATVGVAGAGSLAIDDLSDGLKNTTDNNLFLGHEGGGSTGSTDNFNTAVGIGALDSMTNSSAGFADGDSNTALGYNALTNLTTGGDVTAIGMQAMANSVDPSSVTAIGVRAALNTEGSNNVVIGLGTGDDLTTGIQNVLVGDGAGNELGNGGFNTAIGHLALANATTDTSSNVAIGIQAGQAAASATSIDDNVFIGAQAGQNVDTGADNNVFIGAGAGNTTTTGTSNILIGQGINATAATVSNELNIGNTIYGDLANDLVGIGTATPAGELHIYKDTEDANLIIEGPENDDSALILTTSGDAASLSDADTTHWNFTARGNAHSNTAEQQFLVMEYWDGSAWDKKMLFDPNATNTVIDIQNDTGDATLRIQSEDDGDSASLFLQENGNTATPDGISFVYDGDNNTLTLSGGSTGTYTPHMTMTRNTGNFGFGDFSADDIDSTIHLQSGEIRLDGGAGNEAGCIQYNDTANQLEFSDDCTTYSAFGSGGGGSVGGSDTQIQYNDAGALGAEAAFTYDDSTDTMTVGTVSATDRISLTPKTSIGTPNGLSINDLTDVDTSGLADGEVLTYNSGSGNWESATAASGGGLWTDNADTINYENFYIWKTGTTLTGLGGQGLYYDSDNANLFIGNDPNNKWDEATNTANSIIIGDDNGVDSLFDSLVVGSFNNVNSVNNSGSIIAGQTHSFTNNSNRMLVSGADHTIQFAGEGIVVGSDNEVYGSENFVFGRKVVGNFSSRTAIFSLGDHAGTKPSVNSNADDSFVVFLGDQSGATFDTPNRFAVLGGEMLLDGDPTSGSTGCIRYNDTSDALQFSNDCTSYTNFGSGGTLSGLSDVNTTGADSGEILRFDGSNWVVSEDRVANADLTLNLNFFASTLTPGSWSLTGSGLSLSNSSSAIAGLDSDTVAFVLSDFSNAELRAYSFDGSNWSLDGSALNISNGRTADIATLTSSTVVVVSTDNTGDGEIRTYSFNGSTWSQVGNTLNVGAGFSPTVAALDSNTIAYISRDSDTLQTYSFDGTDWTTVGSALSVNVVTNADITALDTDTIAFTNESDRELRTYSFNGSTWSQDGSSFTVTSADVPAITTLDSSTVAYVDEANDDLRVYRFNGSTWSQQGTELNISGLNTDVSLATLSTTRIAIIDAGLDELRTYDNNGSVTNAQIVDSDAGGELGPLLSTGLQFTVTGTSANDGIYTTTTVVDPDTIEVAESVTPEGPVSAQIFVRDGRWQTDGTDVFRTSGAVGIGTLPVTGTQLDLVGVMQIDNDTTGTGGCIRWNGTALEFSNDCSSYTAFGSSSGNLNDIGDVDAASPTDGQVLTYNNTSGNWEAQAASGGGGSVGGSDTQILFNNSGTEDGDAGLTYAAGTDTLNIGSTVNVGDLVNIGSTTGAAAPTGASNISLALSNLTDVSSTAPTNGQVLTYNNTSGEWEAQTASGGSSDNIQDADGDTYVVVDNGSDNDLIRFGVPTYGELMTIGGGAGDEIEMSNNGRNLFYVEATTNNAASYVMRIGDLNNSGSNDRYTLDVQTDVGGTATRTFGVTPGGQTYIQNALGIGTDPVSGTQLDLVGVMQIDNDETGTGGCIRWSGTQLEFSNDCTSYSAFGGGGGGAINDLTDAATTTNNIFLGNDGGFFGANDFNNTAVGINALDALNNSGSEENTAFGYNALTAATNGSYNVALGSRALEDVVGGGFNVGIGAYALSEATASDNTAIGYTALLGLTTGQRNIAMGNQVGHNLTIGSDNILIGNLINAPANNTSNHLNIGNTIYGDLSEDDVSIGQAAVTAFLDGNGFADLDVAGTVRAGRSMNLGDTFPIGWDDGTVGITGDAANDTLDLFVNSSTQIFVNTTGVGIGSSTAPTVALDVTGDIEYTGTITDVSDRRLKDDIAPLNKHGALIEKIDAIDTYSFTMKDDETNRVEFGVMAQELEKIFPELVHTAEDDMGTKSVNYVGLIAPMIEATKELKAENASLKAELADMKSSQDEIKASLASLNAQVELLNKAQGEKIEKASLLPTSVPAWIYALLGMLGTLCIVLIATRKTAKA